MTNSAFASALVTVFCIAASCRSTMAGASIVTGEVTGAAAPLGCTFSVRSPATAFTTVAVICVSLLAVT